MNRQRVLALARRLVEELRRDRRSLALLFVAPVVLTGLFSFVMRGQGSFDTRAAVVDLDVSDQGAIGAAIALAAKDAGIMHIDLSLPDEAAARAAIRAGDLDVALIVPDGFLRGEVAGSPPPLRLVTAGVNPGADGSHIAAMRQAITGALAAQSPGGGALKPPTIEHSTVYGSPDADSVDVFAPVFIGFFAYFFVFLLTGVSFLRERIGGTLERLLATPVRRSEIVLGYSLGFGLFATLQVAVVLIWSLLDLHTGAIGPLPALTIGLAIPVAGSPLLAYLVTLLLALGAVNLAIFLSTFARTELQIIQFIPIVIVPQAFLSGILFPVDTLPDILQPVARVLPLTYAVEGLREVIIKGADLASRTLQVDLLVLAGIAIVFMVLAAGTIRREVA
ncbi:MAG: ABC transporter permease [Candidatus Limnocylindrales bacterium]